MTITTYRTVRHGNDSHRRLTRGRNWRVLTQMMISSESTRRRRHLLPRVTYWQFKMRAWFGLDARPVDGGRPRSDTNRTLLNARRRALRQQGLGRRT